MKTGDDFLPDIRNFLIQNNIDHDFHIAVDTEVYTFNGEPLPTDATAFTYSIVRHSDGPENGLVLNGSVLFTWIEHEIYGAFPSLEIILYEYFHAMYIMNDFPHMEAWLEAHRLPLGVEELEIFYEKMRQFNEEIRSWLGESNYHFAIIEARRFFESLRDELLKE